MIDGPKPPTKYLVCEEWGHIFHDLYGEETVRWVFDRHLQRIISLQILAPGETWRDVGEEECEDVTESLEQNGVLFDPEEWEIPQCDEMPGWSCREQASDEVASRWTTRPMNGADDRDARG